MKKILIFWFLAIGMANAQYRIGVINGDTTIRPMLDLAALAWKNNNLYLVKPMGNTVKFLQNDSRLWVGDNNRVGIGTKTPSQIFEVAGNAKVTGNFELGDISNVRTAINSKFDSGNTVFAPPLSFIQLVNPSNLAVTNSVSMPQASEYGNGYLAASDWIIFNSKPGLSSNNVFTGTNTFFSPIFANNTSTSTYSKLTGSWSGTGNIATFSLGYESRFGGNTITRTPLSFDYNGWIGVNGVTSPTVALDVSGSIKSTSTISALSINSSSTTLLAGNSGNVGIGIGSPTSKLHVVGTARVTGALQFDNTVSGLLRADASGNITSDNTVYLSTSTASSTYAPISNPSFVGNASSPKFTVVGSGYIANGSDVAMGAGSTADIVTYNTSGRILFSTGGFVRAAITNAGNFGIGTIAPTAKFEISGTGAFKYNDGSVGANKLLTSDATGIASWQTPSFLPINNPTSTGIATFPTISNTLGANFATSSGNVGIGTSAPTSKLTVNGDIQKNDSDGYLGFANRVADGGNYGLYYNSTSAMLQMFTNSSAKLNILSNGNIGIGTTSPVYKLDVNGTTSSTNFITPNYFQGTGTNPLLFTFNGNQDIWSQGASGIIRFIDSGYSNVNFSVNQSGNGYFRGNLGVGTTSPTSQLHIKSVNPVLRLEGSTTSGYLDFNDTRMNLHAGSGYMSLVAGTVERMRISADGNVGIGTTSPARKLEVNGSVYVNSEGNGFVVDAANLSRFGFIKYSGSNAAIAHGNTVPLVFGQTDNTSILSGTFTEQMRIDLGGNVGIGVSNPQKKLDVSDVIRSSNNFAGFELVATTGTSYRWTLNNDNGLYLQSSSDKFVANAATRIGIGATGNVGIGTNLPQDKLQVVGKATFGDAYSSTTGSKITSIRVAHTNQQPYISLENYGNFGWRIGQTGSANGNGLVFSTGDTTGTKLSVLANGNVGIGVNAPTSLLHVNGAGLFNGDLSISKVDPNVNLVNTSTSTTLNIYGGAVAAYNFNNANGHWFGTQGAYRMKIMTSATSFLNNVGIGTESPNAPLQLANTVVNRKIVLFEGTNNDHQFYGFGINGNTLRYQIENPSTNHVFYAGTGTTTSQQLLSINGDQTVTYTPLTTAQINALTKIKGKMAYNSDTDKPVWCNGTVWRYADGSNM